MSDLRLVIFDVDGTLVDSQADITQSMAAGFAAAGQETPAREVILGVVGLSLPLAVARLAPDLDPATQGVIAEGYKRHYQHLRASQVAPVLYPGTLAMIEALHAEPETLLGVATGKSRRGLDALMDQLGLRDRFLTLQCADDHPSKPHPSMLHAAMAEGGITDSARAVIIGDTSFDMEMGRAAGIRPIGVSWGYHDRGALGAAEAILDDWAELPGVLSGIWGQA
ncbi:HAD-IA family hydrolase [Mesobacterium pallidum]|uniref:HAD-IA family hydrolase n=1 Tax=Mesobacterium pallidum TaxID=2872037 RepID=UPI001EE1E8C5|nr:HAD-IA family hydrolase [Mesobacterium pallidum]